MWRRGIGLAIALACAVAALAVPRPLAALVPNRPAPSVPVAAGPPLQQRLTALLDGTVGPGRAAVTVTALVDRNRTSTQSVRYARRGVPVQRQAARTRAGGYSASSGATTWARSATVTSTAFAPGGVWQLHVGLVVSTAVPRAVARRLARTIAVAAGLNRARGDTLALTRARFAAPRPAVARPVVPAAAVRWAVLAVGVLAFLFALVPA